MNIFFLILLAFIPATLAVRALGASPVVLFFLSAIAIVPLAKFIGEATEKLASRTSHALGGLLNATFGNATELIIGAFALNAGLIEIVKASLTGSIIGNLLLVLGSAMFLGGTRYKKQEFNKTAALASGSSLFLAVIALVVPAIFVQTVPGAVGMLTLNMSVLVSLVLIVLYAASLVFSLHTHKHLYTAEVGVEEGGGWSTAKSVWVLAIATVLVAWMSQILVGSITPLIAAFGWTEAFVGIVFIAIIGNAAEHVSAVMVAAKNKMGLALQVAIGSASQIAMFVAPFLVLASLFFAHQMTLVFSTFELVALVLSVLLVNIVVADGESNWLEGLQLMAAYAIIAVAFYFHP